AFSACALSLEACGTNCCTGPLCEVLIMWSLIGQSVIT
ncbi:unnamed protein product, partial [Staurois parvus]